MDSCWIFAIDVDQDERDAYDFILLFSLFCSIFNHPELELVFIPSFGEDQCGVDPVDGTCVIWLLFGTNLGFLPSEILPLINLNLVFELLFGIFPLTTLNLDL